MRPKWYLTDDIPFHSMWPDDYLWFPMMLNSQCFYGYFTFQGMDKIVDYTLEEVSSLDKVRIPQAPLSSNG